MIGKERGREKETERARKCSTEYS